MLILWALFYAVFKAVQGTRAVQVIQFLVLLIVLSYLSKLLNLITVNWVLTTAQMPIFVGLVVLYASELRRAVSELTRARFFRRRGGTIDPVVNEVTQTAQVLSRRHIGALIVFEMSTNLQGFIDTGIKMDSQVTSELLVTLFSPLTPLHDGAVIIRNNRIAAAACLLPLSEREEIDSSWGTRHRAALGLVEETDAVIVIVSEETGAISLAIGGRITRDLDASKFQSILWNVIRKGSRS
ncbi:MAG: diadenylate cyclase CdaA [bacterium]